MMNNKKGNVFDSLDLGVALIGVFILMMIVGVLIQSFNTQIQTSTGMTPEAKTSSASINTRLPLIFDGGFLLLYVGLSLAAIFSAFTIQTNKLYAIFSILILGMIAVISFILSNIYDAFTNQPIISVYLANYHIIPFIMNNYVISFLIVGFAIFIALYAKPGGSGGGYYG